MDGTEAMAIARGSASYYIHRGDISGSGPGTQNSGFHSPPRFRPMTNLGGLAQSNARGSSVGSTFSMEPSNANFGSGIGIGVSPRGAPGSEPVKKKRGRPRKYAPDGAVSLGLSTMSASSNQTLGSNENAPKKNRGRPPGSGRKQQLALLGEWMNSSAGLAFAPQVIRVGPGEDIVAKILSFAQQRPRAVCILSGNGTVSSVTLRQPASTGVSVTYEGRFNILCLSGSYLVAEDGGPQNRTGGVSASLSSPEGQVFGGGVAMLIAACPVQVVMCSFVYGSSKATKTKQVNGSKGGSSSEPEHKDDLITSTSSPPTQNYSQTAPSTWPGSRPVVDLRNPHTGIDLTRG